MTIPPFSRCLLHFTVGLFCYGVLISTCLVTGLRAGEISETEVVHQTDPLPSGSKAGYYLFHPTPKELMREMSTDRPDKTESPYTVDAGHFQVEMDFINYTYERYDTDRTSDTRSETWNVAPINVKAGLMNNVDLQIVFDSYIQQSVNDRTAGEKDETSGIGDLTTRIKVNLLGNDGGMTALAIMPFIKAPTNSAHLGNNSVESGVIIPLAVELPAGWGMGIMTEVDFLKDDAGSGYETDFINSLTFSHDIVGNLGGYVEFFSSVSTQQDSEWVGTVDVGLTYALTKNIQLDCGCNFGVTRVADDYNPFVGISMRF